MADKKKNIWKIALVILMLFYYCKNLLNKGVKMPLLNGRIANFIREYKLVRRFAIVGGVLVGVYFLGASQGWWERFLF